MYRSASTSRASDEFSINLSPATKGSPGLKMAGSDNLPIYNPISDATKKETTSHLRSSGENAVHLIPVVLIICAFILWVFSHPAVDGMNKPGLIVVSMKGLNIDGHDNRTGSESDTKMKDLVQPEQIGNGKARRFILANKFG
ncbi:hypothetical protein HHK36_021501 [Tetracentron sinense]|uniref:Uncharacterized protein n=1 Tax=Tetracentron sinense TaxID=13715 RepID=A0A834YS95_TETSI|nr:hypothetical protein HHK36_021501 [Tetracentron sinense]